MKKNAIVGQSGGPTAVINASLYGLSLIHIFLTYSIKKRGKSMIPKAFSFVEVANYLGMHPVTVSRIARKLRETGILARVDGCLIIQDEEKLRAMTMLQNG